MAVEVRRLEASDDRSEFSSGDSDLDRFLKKFAGQNQFRHHIGTTYVAVEDEHILGFATVSAGAIEVEDLPTEVAKGLPGYPIPILRLGRLAVDEIAKGRGVGKRLLCYVFFLALEISRQYGCVGLVVDAKPDAVSFYETFGFEPIDVLEGASPSRPAPTAMFLALGEVEAALE